MGMYSEAIKVKSKIDESVFKSNIDQLKMDDIDNLPDFILAIDGAKP